MLNVMNSIIHSATNANFQDYIYTQVYASADTTININGQSITLPKGLLLTLNIRSIGSSANVFLLGDSQSLLNPVIL
jgi:hypothetical protein